MTTEVNIERGSAKVGIQGMEIGDWFLYICFFSSNSSSFGNTVEGVSRRISTPPEQTNDSNIYHQWLSLFQGYGGGHCLRVGEAGMFRM